MVHLRGEQDQQYGGYLTVWEQRMRLMAKDWVHSRASLFALFWLCVALGAVASLHRRDTTGVEAMHRPPIAPTVGACSDAAAAAVGDLPEYRQACAARARGNRVQADAILTGLEQSPQLNESQRAFCRRARRQ